MRALFRVLLLGQNALLLVVVIVCIQAMLDRCFASVYSWLNCGACALFNVAQVVQLLVKVLRLERGAAECLTISAGAVCQHCFNGLWAVTREVHHGIVHVILV